LQHGLHGVLEPGSKNCARKLIKHINLEDL
jgi:hypothetical protein